MLKNNVCRLPLDCENISIFFNALCSVFKSRSTLENWSLRFVVMRNMTRFFREFI